MIPPINSDLNDSGGKDRKKEKAVVYDNPLFSIFFQYSPFSTHPNQLKIADFCITSM